MEVEGDSIAQRIKNRRRGGRSGQKPVVYASTATGRNRIIGKRKRKHNFLPLNGTRRQLIEEFKKSCYRQPGAENLAKWTRKLFNYIHELDERLRLRDIQHWIDLHPTFFMHFNMAPQPQPEAQTPTQGSGNATVERSEESSLEQAVVVAGVCNDIPQQQQQQTSPTPTLAEENPASASGSTATNLSSTSTELVRRGVPENTAQQASCSTAPTPSMNDQLEPSGYQLSIVTASDTPSVSNSIEIIDTLPDWEPVENQHHDMTPAAPAPVLIPIVPENSGSVIISQFFGPSPQPAQFNTNLRIHEWLAEADANTEVTSPTPEEIERTENRLMEEFLDLQRMARVSHLTSLYPDVEALLRKFQRYVKRRKQEKEQLKNNNSHREPPPPPPAI